MSRPGNWGGARHGSGKPKGYKSKHIILQDDAKAELIKRILDNWEALVDTKMRLALGDYWIDKDDKPVYKGRPDPNSIDWLMEYAAGKTTVSSKIDQTVSSPQLEKLANTMEAILKGK